MADIKTVRKSAGLNQEDFARSINTSQGNISRIEKGKQDPTTDIINKIKEVYGVEIDVEKSNDLIPYYNVDIMATPVEVFNDQTTKPEYEISLPGFTDCDFAINVYGDSMYPTYRSGSIVLCRRVNDKSLIFFGEVYLVITEDHRAIKRVQKNKKEGFITLTSDNYHAKDEDRKRYEPIEVAIDKILNLFIVKGTLRREQI
jgi:phage repressor protein C with HTH and peptisase S24 domain